MATIDKDDLFQEVVDQDEDYDDHDIMTARVRHWLQGRAVIDDLLAAIDLLQRADLGSAEFRANNLIKNLFELRGKGVLARVLQASAEPAVRRRELIEALAGFQPPEQPLPEYDSEDESTDPIHLAIVGSLRYIDEIGVAEAQDLLERYFEGGSEYSGWRFLANLETLGKEGTLARLKLLHAADRFRWREELIKALGRFPGKPEPEPRPWSVDD